MKGGPSPALLVNAKGRELRQPVLQTRYTYDVAMAFIVECIICSQPWEVDSQMVAVPGHSWLQVPEHPMLNPQTSQPMPTILCPGIQHSGIGVGNRDQWEQNWPQRKPNRPLPDVLDGRPVTIVTN